MRMRSAFVALAIIIACGASASGIGCQDATQLVIDVSTDVDCTAIEGTTITIGKLFDIESKPSAASRRTCDDSGHLGMLVVVPAGDKNDEVAFKVLAGIGVDPEKCVAPNYGASCIVARRAVHFIAHSTVAVSVPLRASCKGVACDPTSTCVAGVCRPARIDDASRCTSAKGCGEETLSPANDGGAPNDASADAGDASPSDATSGPTPELSIGSVHACARLDDATVKCWGQNSDGQLGDGTNAESLTPKLVPSLVGVKQIAATSGVHTCALMNDATVQCWGGNEDGQVGRGGDLTKPGPIIGLANVGQIALGRGHTCAVSTDGASLWCWGNVGGGAASSTQTPIGSHPPLALVAPAENFTVLLTKTGGVYSFGSNLYGQLGLGRLDASFDAPLPQAVGITDATLLAAGVTGGNHVCTVHGSQGELLCWGRNGGGQLGVNGNDSPSPVVVPSLGLPIKQLALGALHTCALLSDSQVRCWGDDGLLQTGEVNGGGPTPFLIPNLSGVVKIWAGGSSTCARKNDGTVWCWGDNTYGQLGDGSKNNTSAIPKLLAL